MSPRTLQGLLLVLIAALEAGALTASHSTQVHVAEAPIEASVLCAKPAVPLVQVGHFAWPLNASGLSFAVALSLKAS